jgi:hypothetical protein
MLVLVAILALPLGWYAGNARQVAAEMRAIGELNQHSPIATIALRDNDRIPSIPPPGNHIFRRCQGPKWLHAPLEWCCSGLLYRAEQVGLQTTDFDDRIVEPLTRLKYLWEINLSRTSVTQDGVDRLRRAFPQAKVAIAE